MRTLLVLALLAVAAGPAGGQAQPEGWLVPFAAAYQPAISGFNQAFATKGLPEARATHYGWGVEIRSLVSHFLVGPMFFRTWDDVATSDVQLRTEATGIFGEVGVKLAPARFVAFVPMVGVGGLNHSFTLRERTGNLPLDSLLQIPGPGRMVSFAPGMKVAGLAALEINLIAATGSGRYGLAVRGGYLYSPLTLAWRLSNGSEVTGVPDIKLGGPFFSAGIVLMPEPESGSEFE
jgi:hypothetical protein